ncbi:hypothetical protein N7537_010758 [Penicillium hordei]|uniref:Uncharacterized protein n=1 Tax=Penicillium hordei TaxID=40994 RepID=A0AAD6DKG3_9EURO|nr:uncharacterized protein N7537_010758 [Penicillium hordei]KAJ5588080.1 hypothetical protein N7537_010758 [Penicillium hordei]
MNNKINTTGNITNAMVNITLTEPQRHKVYIVKYNFDSSPPEGDSVIFVKTSEDVGHIHFIAPNSTGTHQYYNRETIMAHEIKETGENLMLIGTTLTENYQGSWDKALRGVEENQQYAITSLALTVSTQAGMRQLKVSHWTQECARPALEKAGLLEKIVEH